MLKLTKINIEIAYETARADLTYLVKKNLLSQIKMKNKYIFVPDTLAIKNLLKIKR